MNKYRNKPQSAKPSKIQRYSRRLLEIFRMVAIFIPTNFIDAVKNKPRLHWMLIIAIIEICMFLLIQIWLAPILATFVATTITLVFSILKEMWDFQTNQATSSINDLYASLYSIVLIMIIYWLVQLIWL